MHESWVLRRAHSLPVRGLAPLASLSLSRRALSSLYCAAVVSSTGAAQRALAAGGPSSLSGKPRPETGVVLVEPVVQSGRTVSAELICNGASSSDAQAAGLSVVAVFESAFAVAKGNYYDVEARSKEGDSAFVHVAALPAGLALDTVPLSFFGDTALGGTGRFGSYSAPQISRISPAKELRDGGRFVEVSFSALTQGGFEVPRRGFIAALQPTGSSDALMMVSTTSASRWKKGGEADAREAAETFHITQVRPTRLTRFTRNDYRFASRSLPADFFDGTSEIDAALARDLSSQSGALSGKFSVAASSGVTGYGYQNAQRVAP